MKFQSLLTTLLLAALSSSFPLRLQASTQRQIAVDLCVYGGTAAGVAAAVQAARDGRSVALLEPGFHLGGMTSGGLGQTDIGNKGAIGGIAREFYKRVGAKYGKEESWVFEPHAAENVLFEMVNESKVALCLNQPLAAVTLRGNRIVELAAERGLTVHAKVFIDTTYEGDLMAAAGVGYHIGRESNATYGETLNGIRANTPKHQLIFPVDPHKTPGDPSSGLLPLVQPLPAGVHGEGDRTVQAYNFRMVLTQNPENRREIAPPANYDPARFELLARYIQAWSDSGKPLSLGQLMHIQPMPGGKTDINNNGGFSTDHIGANYDYPDGNRATRAKIWRDHEDYTRGFFHFLATDSRIPEKIRAEMRSWGLTKDEFIDTKGWPHQLYVREARRMVSDYVMTEHNCVQSIQVPDAIGLAAYTMDSHNCRRIVRDGRVENEGDVQVGGFPPLPHRLPLHRPQTLRMLEPPRPRLPLRQPHRLRLHPHGAGLHGPRPCRRDRRRTGHRRPNLRPRDLNPRPPSQTPRPKTNLGLGSLAEPIPQKGRPHRPGNPARDHLGRHRLRPRGLLAGLGQSRGPARRGWLRPRRQF